MEEKADVLIVDDNVSLCRTMSFVLGRQGYAVNTAQDGLEAIERVKERPFDMVFMDIKMPLMNGVETYRRIKKIRPEAVVMMMTAYAVEDLVQQALEEGAYGIVYKPLDIEKVVATIEEAAEAKEGALAEQRTNEMASHHRSYTRSRRVRLCGARLDHKAAKAQGCKVCGPGNCA